MRQAAWLTKTQVIPGLPAQLLSLAENPENQIPDQDERVQNAIKHARFWDTTEDRPRKEKYRLGDIYTYTCGVAEVQEAEQVTTDRKLVVRSLAPPVGMLSILGLDTNPKLLSEASIGV